MMLKETVICDKCGKDIPIPANERYARRVSLLNGETTYDPGSGRTSDDTDDLELCASCLVVVCRLAIKALDDETQEQLLKRIRELAAHG